MPQSAFAIIKAASKTSDQDKVVLSTEVIATPDAAVPRKPAKKGSSTSRRKRKRTDTGSTATPQGVSVNHAWDQTKYPRDVPTQDDPLIQYLTEGYPDIDEASNHGEALSSDSLSVPLPILPAAAQNSTSIDIRWLGLYGKAADIKLAAGQSLAIVGEYDIWVKKGSISVLGAMMHSGIELHRIYAPTTHSIPVIKALMNPFGPSLQTTELRVQSASSGIRKLRRCDTMFSRIWLDTQESLASFELLESTGTDQCSRFVTPADWEKCAITLCDPGKPPVVMICGPKNAGKSSFARFLTNSFLSRRYAESGVAYLDLDPGQPEYTTPADLSLIHVKAFNLGPSFTHFASSENKSDRLVRQHHFGYYTPKADTVHYLDCAKDLYKHYKQDLQPFGCPLLINTSGWIQGSGLDVLLSLAKHMLPTHIINLTASEPPTNYPASSQLDDESGSVLQQFFTKLGISPTILSTTSSAPGPRTAADLQSMQFSSFFHAQKKVESLQHQWFWEPLNDSLTLSLPYSGQEKIISAVLIPGDHLNYDMIERVIDRTVLALVAIQQSSPLHKILCGSQRNESSQIGDSDVEMREVIADDSENDDVDLVTGAEIAPKFHLKSNKQGIPYLVYDDRYNPTIDPATSFSLGQVMLNRIDKTRKTFEVHTSLPLSAIRSFLEQEQGMKLLLVRGLLGQPDWFYLEEFVLTQTILEDKAELLKNSVNIDSNHVDLDFRSIANRTPYVEYISDEDLEEVAGFNKARRLRRNLGTAGNKV